MNDQSVYVRGGGYYNCEGLMGVQQGVYPTTDDPSRRTVYTGFRYTRCVLFLWGLEKGSLDMCATFRD
jgi:hypothetical protein